MTPPIDNYLDILTASHIQVGLAPVHNVINSMMLLTTTEHKSGLGSWVKEVTSGLTDDELKHNKYVIYGFYNAIVPYEEWDSFPDYLSHLSEMDPIALRDKMILSYIDFICHKGQENTYTIESIIESEKSYLDFLNNGFEASMIDEELEKWAYSYVLKPTEMKELIINHLDYYWNTYLKEEWEKGLPVLEKCVQSFQIIDFSQMTNIEAAKYVTGRDALMDHWEKSIYKAKQIYFAPSLHIGPYIGKFIIGDSFGIFFGARLPKNTDVKVPELSQMEIYMRLNALADETRLQILKFIAENGESSSTEIIKELDLSQSAASRHLSQLTATGFLIAQRKYSAKYYRLINENIENTIETFKSFLNL